MYQEKRDIDRDREDSDQGARSRDDLGQLMKSANKRRKKKKQNYCDRVKKRQDKLSKLKTRTKSGPTLDHPHWSFHPFGTIQQRILQRF